MRATQAASESDPARVGLSVVEKTLISSPGSGVVGWEPSSQRGYWADRLKKTVVFETMCAGGWPCIHISIEGLPSQP